MLRRTKSAACAATSICSARFCRSSSSTRSLNACASAAAACKASEAFLRSANSCSSETEWLCTTSLRAEATSACAASSEELRSSSCVCNSETCFSATSACFAATSARSSATAARLTVCSNFALTSSSRTDACFAMVFASMRTRVTSSFWRFTSSTSLCATSFFASCSFFFARVCHSCTLFSALAIAARSVSTCLSLASADFCNSWPFFSVSFKLCFKLSTSPFTTCWLCRRFSTSSFQAFPFCSALSTSCNNFFASFCASTMAWSLRCASVFALSAACVDFRRSSRSSAPRGRPPRPSASSERSESRALALTSTTLRLTLAFTSTRMAREAKSKVLSVSEALSAAGLAQTSRAVLQLPPIDPSKMRVSLESRSGMCAFLAAKALTTLPKASKLLLIAVASLNWAPSTPLFFTRSDPAKSTT
mmetsp:Transcript_17586/g.61475  ORF Transcript_17586/g.61475 Transcript_17586/m.61475 type:complete len:421 (-) Transcript_17586:873-2135(-)